jgi:hypothetical protein
VITMPITDAYESRVLSEGGAVIDMKAGYWSVQSFDGLTYVRRGDRAPTLDAEGVPTPGTIVLRTNEKEIFAIQYPQEWYVLVEVGAKAQVIFRGYL